MSTAKIQKSRRFVIFQEKPHKNPSFQKELPIWVFPKIVVPPNGWCIMENPKTLLKWMIWGYHYFRNPPYVFTFKNATAPFFSNHQNWEVSTSVRTGRLKGLEVLQQRISPNEDLRSPLRGKVRESRVDFSGYIKGIVKQKIWK